jgi:polysaccharide export outer membrane protein
MPIITSKNPKALKMSLQRSCIVVLVTFFSHLSVQAQRPVDISRISDKQIESFMKEAESRGLSEDQIEALAKSRGYSDAEIISIRERVNRIKSGTANTSSVTNTVVREQIEEVAERAEVQVKSDQPVIREELYGERMFRNKSLNFEPNLRIPTSPNYIIGVGDELRVDITGYAAKDYTLGVSPEGTVKLEHFSPIYINGLTIAQAKDKIRRQLGTLYAGLNNGSLNLDMTLSKVKSIKVTVVGEVQNPGTYTVSSLATLFNVLYQSGGPTRIGSFRNIRLLRNNKIIHNLDLYEFLQKGLLTGDVPLTDQDVVFVPASETIVRISGEVKRPMKYELKSGENMANLLVYAGGFTEKAYTAQLALKRKNDKELEIRNIELAEEKNILLRNGDELHVSAILDRFTNRVEILGAVFRPGEFALDNDLQTVSQLIKKADGLREDAFRGRAVLKRERENLDPEFIALDLNEILSGEKDITLKREDVLIIRSLVELREERKVSISGEINLPGQYDYTDNLTVSDLIFLAGGFRQGATQKRIEVARRLYNDEQNDSTVELFNINIDKDLNLRNDAPFVLLPFDQVFVRTLANYQPQQSVRIEGEVNYPSRYVIESKKERISDLIERAGGLRNEAYIKGAKFYRDGRLVALDLVKALNEKAGTSNLFLEEGDRLVIPREEQIVELIGQVQNPTSVAFQPDFSFRDYIRQAGGYTDSAHVKKVYVRYASGLTDRTRSFMGIRSYPQVERGMEIHVPVKRKDKISRAELVTLTTAVTSMMAVVVMLIRVL